MSNICFAWEFKHNEHSFVDILAREFVKRMEKTNVAIYKKRQLQRIQATTIGILWNECLKSFTLKLLEEWTSEPTMSISTMFTTCKELFTSAFENFNEKKRREVEIKLLMTDVKSVLADKDLLVEKYVEKDDSDKEDKGVVHKLHLKLEEIDENGDKRKEGDVDKKKMDKWERRKKHKEEGQKDEEKKEKKITRQIDFTKDTELQDSGSFSSQKSASREFGGREEITTSNKLKKSKQEGTPAKNEEKREKRFRIEEKYIYEEEKLAEYKERDRWDRDRWEREKEKGERDEKRARGENDEGVDKREKESTEKPRKVKNQENQKVVSDEDEDKPPDTKRKTK